MLLHDTALISHIAAVAVFLMLVAILRHYAQRSPLPPESWLLLAGVVYALLQRHILPWVPEVNMEPAAVNFLILPALIFASGTLLAPKVLVTEAVPIGVFALVGSLLSTLLIGIPTALMLGIPWVHGLWFGVAVAATDPAAVAVVLRRFAIPERLEALMEGESVFNDSVAIALFTALAAMILGGRELQPGATAALIAWGFAGAIGFGMLLGWLAGRMVVRWREQNRFPGLTLTLLLAYGSFLIAETVVQLSGVITTLCAALVFTSVRRRGAATTHDEDLFHGFWAYLSTLAGSALFFLLGVETGSHPYPVSWVIPGVIGVLLVARLVVVYGNAAVLGWCGNPLPASWRHVLFWGGARGAVPAALLLLVPEDYPYHTVMLCLIFTVVLFTLLIHPLVLRWYLARTRITDAPAG